MKVTISVLPLNTWLLFSLLNALLQQGPPRTLNSGLHLGKQDTVSCYTRCWCYTRTRLPQENMSGELSRARPLRRPFWDKIGTPRGLLHLKGNPMSFFGQPKWFVSVLVASCPCTALAKLNVWFQFGSLLVVL